MDAKAEKELINKELERFNYIRQHKSETIKIIHDELHDFMNDYDILLSEYKDVIQYNYQNRRNTLLRKIIERKTTDIMITLINLMSEIRKANGK